MNTIRGVVLLLAALAPNGGHMFAVLTDNHSTSAACLAGFVGGEFVCGALRMSGLAAFARDGTLFVRVHRRESAPARIAHGLFLSVVGPKYDTFSHSDVVKTTLRHGPGRSSNANG
jgi:hypothetical protein